MEIIKKVEVLIIKFVSEYLEFAKDYAEYAYILIAFAVILALGMAANFLVKRFLLGVLRSLATKTKTKVAEYLLEESFFLRLSHLAPAFVISSLSYVFFSDYPVLLGLVDVLVNLYLVGIALWVFDSLIDTFYKLYEESSFSNKLPLKGMCQAIKIIVNGTGIIFILSILLDKSPLYFFSGLGALTAVLLLVFKDVILGLVAGVQLTANNMVRKGDWVEMPKYGADGDVIDVALTTVKIQNWDKTITTIPAHALVSDAFKNWRGMSESGGRRIKRSIHLDLSSVRFLKESEVEELEKIVLLKDYFAHKREDIGESGMQVERHGLAAPLLNGRNLTNSGTFRAYCLEYLRDRSDIHKQGMTFLVRQLAPTEKGLPIEIYVFVSDVRWVHYEAIQSDIFDHLLSSLPIFGLRAFQFPTDASLSGINSVAS
ncbi:MAG: mechanosensitive ion channel domain-containing protein [Verrucomicrobiota bacterium]|nr:mechanosensitive ion channel domain-containing protein [Verrucomicrobiota bacterium]